MKHTLRCLPICPTLFLAFLVAMPASSQPVKSDVPENAPPVSSDDGELRAQMGWERGLALQDEFLVQSLMADGVDLDPDRADKVRLILLEGRIDKRKTMAELKSKRGPDYDRQRMLRDIGAAGVALAAGLKRKLLAVLTTKELDVMEASRNDAHLQAVLCLPRHDDKPDDRKPDR